MSTTTTSSPSGSGRTIRIGGASGFWGDSQIAVPQLLQAPIDYLVFDYLAETTMSILQRARLRNPELGYATDFVSTAVKPNLRALMERKVRLVSNAGGLNPAKCRDALLALAHEQGLSPRIAIVTGDDVLELGTHFRSMPDEDAAAAPAPAPLMSANAYLGAFPIAEALRAGADIVITGRCVDSASLLGIAAYEFGWSFEDYDRLAQASLAGHLIECGAQATGGLFTDWETVPDWAGIGYPIVELRADGSFELTKPAATGGRVDRATVAEQLLYEIGDPASYALPDVVCDFTQVRIEDSGDNRVRVTGARGRAPSAYYKVTATFQKGFQIAIMMAIRGQRAKAKAERTAQELLDRTQRLMRDQGFADYSSTLVELLGAESMYGPHRRVQESREIVLRIAAQHEERKALEFLQKESASAGTSMGPGTRSHFGGRSDVQGVIGTASCYIAKAQVPVRLQSGALEPAVEIVVPAPRAASGVEAMASPAGDPAADGDQDDADAVRVPLSRLAQARSGDKGDDANIGVIARRPEWVAVLQRQLTAARVRDYFAHLIEGQVTRFALPGLGAFNFFLERALGGGGSCSLRSDPLGKCYAQMLLDMEVSCPRALLPASADATAAPAESLTASHN